jgi:hypothetical protein
MTTGGSHLSTESTAQIAVDALARGEVDSPDNLDEWGKNNFRVRCVVARTHVKYALSLLMDVVHQHSTNQSCETIRLQSLLDLHILYKGYAANERTSPIPIVGTLFVLNELSKVADWLLTNPSGCGEDLSQQFQQDMFYRAHLRMQDPNQHTCSTDLSILTLQAELMTRARLSA